MLTGSRGFIGTNIRKKIENVVEYDVKIHKDMTILDYDRISEFMKTEKPNMIIHLAANPNAPLSVKEPLLDLQLNAEGTINILRAAVDNQIEHFVLASTAYIYGDPVILPINESHPLQPKSPYGISKIAAENYALFFHKKYGLPLSILRFFTIYGPWQALGYVVPDLVERISNMKENSGDIVLRGTPNDSRDFLWVGDLVDAITKVLDVKPNGEILNLGGQEEIKISTLAETIGELMGKKLNCKYANVETDKQSRLVADSSKARRLLGWQPKTSLRDGLVETLKIVKSNL